MPEPINRHPRNAVGAYYVDDSCVDCDRCRSIAPATFTRDEESGMTYVYRQPTSPDEQRLAEEGRLDCPTDSIGNYGHLAVAD